MTTLTQQQMMALVYRIENHQLAQIHTAYAPALSKIKFNYQPSSLKSLDSLFRLLSKKITLSQLLAVPNIDTFLLAIAGYIGNYIALATNETISWYTYDEALVQIEQKNQLYGTHATLTKTLENSVVAQIGNSVFCQPLKIILDQWSTKDSILDFIEYIKQPIFHNQKVKLSLEPNEISRQYLAKIKTGYLLDESFEYYQSFQKFHFDYSFDSLTRIDNFLNSINHLYRENQQTLQQVISRPAMQEMIRLLGFYLGATVARSLQTFTRWSKVTPSRLEDDTTALKNNDTNFLLLLNNKSYKPMRVIMDGLISKKPTMTLEQFYIQAQKDYQVCVDNHTASKLKEVDFDKSNLGLTKKLPKAWQSVFLATGMLLSNSLRKLEQGEPLRAQFFELDSQKKNGKILRVDSVLDNPTLKNDYEKIHYLANQNKSEQPFFIGVCDVNVNLPQGMSDGLLVTIKTYQSPILALEFFVPYRSANDLKGFCFYNFFYDEYRLPKVLSARPKMLDTAMSLIYESLCYYINKKSPFSEAYWVKRFDLEADSPKKQTSNKVDLSVPLNLELLALEEEPNTALVELDEDEGISFYHLIERLRPHQFEYLQVVTPAWLKKDILFSQIEAMPKLYQTGKIVWCSVVWANSGMYYPKEDNCAGEVVYDPLGRTSLEDLREYAQKLFALKGTRPTEPDQKFYADHINSTSSRIFDLPYPKSLADVNLRVSSIWFWRSHLPNGMLSDFVLPIIISEQTEGRVMVLPARFWLKSFYQEWIDKAKQRFDNVDGYDLLPNLEQDEMYGSRFMGKGVDDDILPKIHQIFGIVHENKKQLENQTASYNMNKNPSYSQFGKYLITQK